MRDLFLLASDVQLFCRDRGWRFCFIGGLALQRWGEPRLTADVDLTILTGVGPEVAYIDELCRTYSGSLGWLPCGERTEDAPYREFVPAGSPGTPIQPALFAVQALRTASRFSVGVP